MIIIEEELFCFQNGFDYYFDGDVFNLDIFCCCCLNTRNCYLKVEFNDSLLENVKVCYVCEKCCMSDCNYCVKTFTGFGYISLRSKYKEVS